MDNRAREGFAAEHGLSLWIEAAGKSCFSTRARAGPLRKTRRGWA